MTRGAWIVAGLSPEGAESFARLTLALAGLTDRGVIPPCRHPNRWHRWTSEDGAEREAAAHECRTCPLLDVCKPHGTHERAGVWGEDRTPRPGGRPRGVTP